MSGARLSAGGFCLGAVFLLARSAVAPGACPGGHHQTRPMRKKAREAGLGDYVNLWVGQAYPLTRAVPAADLVAGLWEQAEAALTRASGLLAKNPAPDGGAG